MAVAKFSPKIIESLKGYKFSYFKSDLISGITVGIVSIPLAIAFSIAAGVPPVVGLYTSIIAGFVISLLGGSKYQIGGPTGAFVIIIYGIVAKYGYDGLIMATILAGIILIVIGYAGIGSYIKFIPYPVTTGFTAGIGVVLFSTQLKDLFGFDIQSIPVDFIGKWSIYIDNFNAYDLTTLLIGLGTIIILLFIRANVPQIPAHVVSIVVMALIVYIFKLDVDTIGSRYGEIPFVLPSIYLPEWSFEKVKDIFPSALTIALLAGIESLLSAVVADGMKGEHHDSNTELIGQGFGNIFSGLFGGIPATGAVARTATNVKSGAKTPIAGIVHAIFILLFAKFFLPLIEAIPLAALAGILLVISVDMIDFRDLKHLFDAPKGDVMILVSTMSLTILIDLTVAVQVGVVMASLLFMKRMSDVTNIGKINLPNSNMVTSNKVDLDAIDRKTIPLDVEVYEINGPFFFGVADTLIGVLERISKPPKVFILRMRHVPAIDATGIHALENFYRTCSKMNINLLLSGVKEQPYNALKKMNFTNMIGEKNITKNIDDALQRAKNIININNQAVK